MKLSTLDDVRDLVEKHLPAQYRTNAGQEERMIGWCLFRD
jgi:hypothetical protein